MPCRPVLDARDYGIVPRAGDVTVNLALASVAAACNNYGFNKWLLSRIYACSIDPQYLDAPRKNVANFCVRLR